MILQLTDQHALALTEAYRAATFELLLAQQRRSALVEALLTGHPSPDAGPWEAAALLGLPPDGQLVVAVAATRGLAEESLPGIERQLAARGVVFGWRLTPAQQLGVASLHVDLPEDRSVLLDILNAYLDHAGSAERAAHVLYCHPNTVRYRLRRLQKLTGRSLSAPDGIAELATATYALRLNSAIALWQGQHPPAANQRMCPAEVRHAGPDQRPAISRPMRSGQVGGRR